MESPNVIRIRNAVFYAYHGVLKEEQSVGGKFELDVDMFGDFRGGAEVDSLKRTVDYEKVYAFVKEIVHSKKFYLLEALASTIARRVLMEFGLVDAVMVRIRKPHPPVRGVVDFVEVEVTEKR